MKTEKLKEKYERYELTRDDVFKHQHYIIITRSGIEKIQALENIQIWYEAIKCEPNFAAVKATGTKNKITIETFGLDSFSKNFKEVSLTLLNVWFGEE